jgi:hypothetical protein
MRTTIELPDELFRQAKIRAIHEGVPLKELFTRYVESGLERSAERTSQATSKRIRSELPIARPATGSIIPYRTNAELDAILTREDVEKALAGTD